MINFEMSEDQAESFSLFLKRIGLTGYRQWAVSDDEAYTIQDAGDVIRRALMVKGVDPR